MRLYELASFDLNFNNLGLDLPMTHHMWPLHDLSVYWQSIVIPGAMLNMFAETTGRPFQSTFVPRTAPSTSYASASKVQRKKYSRDVLVANSQNPSNGRGGSDLARMETAVPVDQRPATQLKELREAQLYSWVRIL